MPKKGGGLRPILDLRVLNQTLHKLPFKMLKQKCIIRCIQLEDWFAVVDLKDTYFKVSITQAVLDTGRSHGLRSRPWLSESSPSGLSLSPRVFTKVALSLLWEVGIRILNYINDWLIIASLEDSCVITGTLCSGTSVSWGFRSAWKRASPCAENLSSLYGVRLGEYDGASHHRACTVQA